MRGTFKGWDEIGNIVLENAVEFLRQTDDHSKYSGETRSIKTIVCRTTSIITIYVVGEEDGVIEMAADEDDTPA